MIPIHQFNPHNSLMFFLILFSFLFVGLLRAFYWKHTKLLLIAPFQYRYASQYLRQDNAFTERVNWLSFIILFINFSLLLVFNKQILIFENHLLFLCLVFVFYFLKFYLIKFLGKLLFIHEVARLTIFYTFLSDKALAIFITPLILILFYFSVNIDVLILYSILFLSIVFLLFKLYWIWKVGTNSFGLSSIYIFLYLCILEIYPFVIITKGFFY